MNKYRVLVENSVVGIYIIGGGKFTYVNKKLADIFDYSSEEVIGMSPLELTHEDDKNQVQSNIKKRLDDGISSIEYSFKGITKEGAIKYIHVYGTVSEINGVQSIIGTLIDETEKTLARKDLEHLVNYDTLTGLFNRHYFNLQFEHIMNQAKRHNTKVALFLFDIDNFKRINDSLGHKAGDIVLTKTAELVQEVLRESDYFFRIGGDEFTIIMENFHSSNEVKLLAQRVEEALKASIEIDELSIHISLSIGISLFPDHGDDINTLQKSADIAMYQSKKEGKNRFTIFAKDSGSSSEIIKLENELYEGIERGELELYLQPQVDLTNNKLIGAEALVRWNHPKRGILTPNVFLPLAQEAGLMYKLDLVMIENTFLLLRKYEVSGLLNFTISVNISNALFHHQRFFSIMQKFQQRYTHLCSFMKLELTEDILMVDSAHAVKMVKSLRLIGYTTAIDDFGTGYSSLSHLKTLEIDELKIDRAFIRDLSKSKKDRAIVKAIVDMGHTLELQVLAEGTEDKIQVDLLKEMGCDLVQGYYFSKPVSVEEFETQYLL